MASVKVLKIICIGQSAAKLLSHGEGSTTIPQGSRETEILHKCI